MDFARILEAWEKQGDQNPPVKGESPHPRTGPSRRHEIERAPIDDELDLHGLDQETALTALSAFIAQCHHAGLAKVLIIHGKGLHSENGRAVLREAVQRALTKDNRVAFWGAAGQREGGHGASWAWLGDSSVRGI